jgi:hypothetical protein
LKTLDQTRNAFDATAGRWGQQKRSEIVSLDRNQPVRFVGNLQTRVEMQRPQFDRNSSKS